jgi:hypothetical protein
MVLDGDTPYVDRNGNGDLTEPSDKINVEKVPGHDSDSDWFSFEIGDVSVGGRTRKATARPRRRGAFAADSARARESRGRRVNSACARSL